MAFWWSSCASPESSASINDADKNFIIWGLWTGISAPVSAISKYIFGMNISVFDMGKKSSLSYWLGYLFALYLYARLIRMIWLSYREKRHL